MARLRISAPARADLAHVLAISLDRWGQAGQHRYRALIEAAFRALVSDPEGPTTRERSQLLAGIRSFHLRHVRSDHGVGDPVHVIYYKVRRSASVEIVRVLHERMDPTLQIESALRPRGRRR
jgi:toxin ParE1/3/4